MQKKLLIVVVVVVMLREKLKPHYWLSRGLCIVPQHTIYVISFTYSTGLLIQVWRGIEVKLLKTPNLTWPGMVLNKRKAYAVAIHFCGMWSLLVKYEVIIAFSAFLRDVNVKYSPM